MVNDIKWCDTKVCVADILTKKSAPLTKTVMQILETNKMIDLSVGKQKRKKAQ